MKLYWSLVYLSAFILGFEAGGEDGALVFIGIIAGIQGLLGLISKIDF